MEITTSLSNDTAILFKKAFPVSFRVLNEKYEEKIYLEDKPSSGLLELTNDSGRELYFIPSDPRVVADPDNFHFALRFRPGILKSDAKSLIKHKVIKKGWSLSIGLEKIKTGEVTTLPIQKIPLQSESDTQMPNGNGDGVDVSENYAVAVEKILEESTTVLYFLNHDKGAFAQGEKIVLPLKQLHLQADEGSQVTQLELTCRNLAKDHEYYELITPHTRHATLTLINHRGNPHMPIHVGFTGFNTILNDGSANQLTLRITNLQKKTPEARGTFTFSHRKHSRMYLYFETDTVQSDYALGKANQVAGIELKIRQPEQPKTTDREGDNQLVHEPIFQGDTPIWEIHPHDGDVILQAHQTKFNKDFVSELPDDSCLDILLSEIKTNFLMGTTHLYIRFENIPGYWDYTYTIPIVKQPMVFRSLYDVSVRSNRTNRELDEVKTVFEKYNLAMADYRKFNNRWIPPIIIKSNISYSFAIQLTKDLEGAGASASLIAKDYVGIGTTEPTNKLSVIGNADFSGNLGIGNSSPSNKLSVEGNANFSGNMGIGKAPHQTNKLSVNGNADFSGNVSTNLLTVATDTTVQGKIGVGKAPHQSNRLSVNGSADFSGNLEIGTNNSKAQLRVEGDVVFANKGFSVSLEDSNKWKNIAIGANAALLTFIGYKDEQPPVPFGFSVLNNRKTGEITILQKFGEMSISATSPNVITLPHDSLLRIYASNNDSYAEIKLENKQGDGNVISIKGRFQSLAI